MLTGKQKLIDCQKKCKIYSDEGFQIARFAQIESPNDQKIGLGGGGVRLWA